MKIETILNIPTTHCQGCIENLTKSLSSIKGLAVVKGNSDTKKISITSENDHLTTEQIENAVKKTGHTLQTIKFVKYM